MDRIYEKFFSLMVNDQQSTMDKMLDTLNEKATYQQCIEGDIFLNGYSSNIMKFLICGKYLLPAKVQCPYD